MPTREKRAQALGISVDQLPDGRGRHGNHAKGRQCARWNDGRLIDDKGYVKIRVGVGHPLADPNGYAYEHLVVWIAAGRERPQLGWLLHHIDENKTNNRLDNLEMLPRQNHSSLHIASRRRDATTGRLIDGCEHNEFP